MVDNGEVGHDQSTDNDILPKVHYTQHRSLKSKKKKKV